MALSNTISSYEDIRPHLDRALASVRGTRITTSSRGQAINLRQRLYKLRQLEKTASVDLFEVGDSRRGRSPWDDLKIELDGASLLILHAEPVRVEDL